MDALNKDLIISISSKNNFVVIYQIFSCVTAVLKTDKSAEVRRAAVLVITLLLRGLGKNIMEVNSFNLFIACEASVPWEFVCFSARSKSEKRTKTNLNASYSDYVFSGIRCENAVGVWGSDNVCIPPASDNLLLFTLHLPFLLSFAGFDFGRLLVFFLFS